MKVSLSWLKEYVDITMPPQELADQLAMVGLEAKSVTNTGGEWENVFVGELLAVDPHPNADRLRLATVNYGEGQETVVCGAPNLTVGGRIAFARVGARLTDPYTGKTATLKKAKIRGVSSSGMVCSERELGLSDAHTGILELPEDAPVGTPLADYIGDTIFDFEVTPNRPDLLSVIGIAREIAALTRQPVRMPDITYPETGASLEGQISVDIYAPDLCPRYCASLIRNVTWKPSPRWMQERLIACGLRPISNIVDVTNYVMLEYGQPLHSFDYDQIRQQKIVVRRAAQGEPITTLDDESRTLSDDMLVIADGERSVALAGVMGGENSEITEEATNILLEAANFHAANIHHTGAALSIDSEARYRFERGIRPELAEYALRRATYLILELAGGEVAQGIADTYPGKDEKSPIALSVSRMSRLMGYDYTRDDITGIFSALGFEWQQGDTDDTVKVISPYWRSDIKIEEDLMEEVIRIDGYDKIPVTLLSEQLPEHLPNQAQALRRELLHVLTGCGLQEIVSFSLIGLESIKNLNPDKVCDESGLVRIANPMTIDMEYFRPDLRANVLSAVASNLRHGEAGVAVFEMGKTFVKGGEFARESEYVCGAVAGLRCEQSWQGAEQSYDFYDAKGIAETVLDCLGCPAGFVRGTDVTFHPFKNTDISVNGTVVGVTGEVHPVVAKSFDIEIPVYLFELDLKKLVSLSLTGKSYTPVNRFPVIVHDMSLLVDEAVTHQQIYDIISKASLVQDVSVFDIYQGKGLPEGKKSMGYRICFQSPDHTLTDDEVNKVQNRITGLLEKELNAVLRGVETPDWH